MTWNTSLCSPIEGSPFRVVIQAPVPPELAGYVTDPWPDDVPVLAGLAKNQDCSCLTFADEAEAQGVLAGLWSADET